jgi:hypothetical protein
MSCIDDSFNLNKISHVRNNHNGQQDFSFNNAKGGTHVPTHNATMRNVAPMLAASCEVVISGTDGGTHVIKPSEGSKHLNIGAGLDEQADSNQCTGF